MQITCGLYDEIPEETSYGQIPSLAWNQNGSGWIVEANGHAKANLRMREVFV